MRVLPDRSKARFPHPALQPSPNRYLWREEILFYSSEPNDDDCVCETHFSVCLDFASSVSASLCAPCVLVGLEECESVQRVWQGQA